MRRRFLGLPWSSASAGWLIVEMGVAADTAGGGEGGEFGAELVGVGVVEVVEDGEGLVPGVVGGVVVAGGAVGVADADEGGGFVVAVAEVAAQGECVVVAGEGLGVVAEVVVGVAEAVPGVGLPVAVAEFLVQGEGVLAGGEGLVVVAEQGVGPAELVEGEGLPGVVQGLRVVALLLPQDGQADVGVGLAGLVAGLDGQLLGEGQVGLGVLEAAQLGVGAGEVAVGAGLHGRVGQAVGGGHRGTASGG